MPQIRLSGIYVYPVKSLPGIRLKEAQLEQRGLRYDRRWMIVDRDGTFITQRTNPQLALIQTELAGAAIRLAAPGFDSLEFEAEPAGGEKMDVSVWGDRVQARSAPAQVDRWLSRFVGESCHLVYMPESEIRPTRRTTSGDFSGYPVSFADGFPILLIGQASLDDLNKRLQRAVSIRRFRPNLVVEGSQAYEEDSWRRMACGEIRMQFAKRCIRCSVTTVDPDSGEWGREPLTTLAAYRKGKEGVCFGVNLVPENTGPLSQGDLLRVLE